MKEIPYYDYEKKHKCKCGGNFRYIGTVNYTDRLECGGDLHYVGILNYTKRLECTACHQEFLVDEINRVKTDGSTGFFGYENFRELI